jgi:hypothetical protein
MVAPLSAVVSADGLVRVGGDVLGCGMAGRGEAVAGLAVTVRAGIVGAVTAIGGAAGWPSAWLPQAVKTGD